MDWWAAAGIVVAVVFGLLAMFYAHFHSKLEKQTGRAELIADMLSRDMAKGYADGLGRALQRLRLVAGGPGSWQSLGFCLTLAMLYALFAAIAGWGSGGAGELGALPLFERPTWVPGVVPDPLVALLSALALVAAGLAVFVILRFGERLQAKLTAAGRPIIGGLAFAFAGAVAVAFAVAVAGAGAGAFADALIEGINENTVSLLVFLTALPLINAISDYASLGFSHWFGLKIVRDEAHSVWRALGWTVVDVGLALVFMGVAALTIPMALAGLQSATGFDLNPRGFVTEAACDPWGAGLWFGIMILTTLFWTVAHLVIAVVGFGVRVYDGFLLDPWAARVIESGRDSLRVKLYLSGKGVLAVGICAGVVWGGFEVVNWLVHGVAQAFGSDTGLIGLLEIIAHTGVDWVLGAPVVPTPRCL